VKPGPNGRIKIFTWAATDLRIDVYGYFTPAATTTTYTYDNDGLRTTKTAADGTITTYRWDKTNPLIPLLLTETTGTNTTRYIYGPGGTPYEQINPDGSITYLHRDQLGSTRLLTNSSGNDIGERAYTPYGKPLTTTGTATTPFGYTGQYTDTETGNQYLRARYYNPTTAQFISRDPLTLVTKSPYAYAGNTPTAATDPSGLEHRACDSNAFDVPLTDIELGGSTFTGCLQVNGKRDYVDSVELEFHDTRPIEDCTQKVYYASVWVYGRGSRRQDVDPTDFRAPLFEGASTTVDTGIEGLFDQGTKICVQFYSSLNKRGLPKKKAGYARKGEALTGVLCATIRR